jgi:hypothetical protein
MKTKTENPNIMHDANVKGWETRKEDPNSVTNSSISRKRTKLIKYGDENYHNSHKHRKTFEDNPSIGINLGKKISEHRILNKICVGKNNNSYASLEFEILINLYFDITDFKKIKEDYYTLFNKKLGRTSYDRFLNILDFPINTLHNRRPGKVYTYIKFVKDNKHKIQWYIENYERLEEEYFERKWENKYVK